MITHYNNKHQQRARRIEMFKITYSNHDQGNHGGSMVRESKEVADRTAKLMAECGYKTVTVERL